MAAAKSRRRVVLHEDDVGMCHGANSAFLELVRLGVCSSGSVMVPCPWFLEIAEAAAADPSIDLGVHLTLNAEKRHYKWRPLTAPSPKSGLTDEHGFFHPDVATTRRKASPEAVETELRAQIDAAYAAGIDVTHLDAHMGAAFSPEFCDIYIRLGLEYRLPILLTRPSRPIRPTTIWSASPRRRTAKASTRRAPRASRSSTRRFRRHGTGRGRSPPSPPTRRSSKAFATG